MDRALAIAHISLMRVIAIFAVLGCAVLAACSGDPSSYGITGPGVQTVPPPSADPGNATTAGVAPLGTSYGTSVAPTRGPTGFWGYNQ